MSLPDRLEFAFNEALIRRLLVKYFHDRGFAENFDNKVYPPMMQDLIEAVPELVGKVELEPFAVEVDPTSGFARLGWNLFALGNQRMYLGETEHADLEELARSLDSMGPILIENDNEQVSRQTRTARDVVAWMANALGNSEAGLVRMVDTERVSQPNMLGNSQASSFFERPKAIRPEGSGQF